MQNSLLHRLILLIALLITGSQWTMGQHDDDTSGKSIEVPSLFDSTFETALYKGSLDISRHHISGLFFIKKISGEDVRIIFSNELGFSFFDLEFKGNNFIVHSCFPSLSRTSLLKLFENDFRLLFFPDTTIIHMKRGKSKDPELFVFRVKSAKGAFRYTVDKDSGKIRRIQTLKSIMGKTDLWVYGESSRQPQKLHIMNSAIRIHFKMVFIKK